MPTRDEMNSASGAFLSPLGLQGHHRPEKSASPATGQRRDAQGDLERYGDIIRRQAETIDRLNERIAALEADIETALADKRRSEDIGLFLGVEDRSHAFNIHGQCARCGRDEALIAESGPRTCAGWGKDDITKPPPGYND